MKPFLIIAGILLVLFLVLWLGLQVKPKPFPAYAAGPAEIKKVPLPDGLPAPVERFYHTVYGDRIPVIDSVVIQGRGVIKPFMNIPLPARFIFIHKAGKDYRHYIEATWFGLPILKVDEGYVDGVSFFEAPMGSYTDDPNTNQGANLGLWAETGWFPAVWVTDPRVHWGPLDDHTAVLFVPFEDGEENFVVRFNPETDLIDTMEVMRYREAGEGKKKILWLTGSLPGPTIEGTPLSATGTATWLDMGKPWAVFTLEELTYNVDLGDYLRARGR